MRNTTPQEFLNIVFDIFSEHGLAKPLQVDISFNIQNNTVLPDNFTIAVFQQERGSDGGLIRHFLFFQSIEDLRSKLAASIVEKKANP